MKIIEDACFPEAEAATLASLSERLKLFPESFLVAEVEGELVGFVNGAVIDEPIIRDAPTTMMLACIIRRVLIKAYSVWMWIRLSEGRELREKLLMALIDASRKAARKA